MQLLNLGHCAKMDTFEIDCCVQGYHVYQRLWTATFCENLSFRQEPINENDRYAVAVTKEQSVIGHIPCKFSHCLFEEEGILFV